MERSCNNIDKKDLKEEQSKIEQIVSFKNTEMKFK